MLKITTTVIIIVVQFIKNTSLKYYSKKTHNSNTTSHQIAVEKSESDDLCKNPCVAKLTIQIQT